jgi:serine/threonine protein kinase/beta-lactam-binding protein with PASTA domain
VTGRYEIGEEIGRGATSVVHRGRDLRLHRDVAVKVVPADHDHDPAYLARFRRQVSNAALLNHPGIVAVYDTGELPVDDDDGGGEPFVVMELVDGRTLRAELDDVGALPTACAVQIVVDICAALDFSHRHGIVHRAVRPENVMLEHTDTGEIVKVMDFGMSRPGPTDNGSAAGRTAWYLSPEQARGEPVDARSDVYGTGCLLYELLTGSVPFTGDDPVTVAYRQVGEPARPPSEIEPGVPSELDAIVLKALAKDPLDRYQSVADLRSALVRACAGSAETGPGSPGDGGDDRRPAGSSPPLLAPPTRTGPDENEEEDEQQPPRRSRRVAAFVGLGAVGVIALAAAVWLTMSVLTAPPPPRPVAVPDLSGMTVDQARKTLAAKDLTVGAVTEQDSAQDETGRVLFQRPSRLTEVGSRTPVNLVIGRGVRAVSVPDLAGMTAAGAKQELTALGLKYTEQRQPSSDADNGKVVTQAPAAHEQAAPGSEVILTVGTGLTRVDVPDGIIGVSVDEATDILARSGLTAVGVEQDGTVPTGVVMSTDHAPGDRVPEGSPITLNYSNNALMIVPNLVGRSRFAAAQLLADQGWSGNADMIRTSSAPATADNLVGVVVTQQPAAGSTVPKLGAAISVGIGVKQITMPELVGRTRAEAENQLRAAGATNVRFAEGGTGPPGQSGRVSAQNVPGGSPITADTAIVVVLYR